MQTLQVYPRPVFVRPGLSVVVSWRGTCMTVGGVVHSRVVSSSLRPVITMDRYRFVLRLVIFSRIGIWGQSWARASSLFRNSLSGSPVLVPSLAVWAFRVCCAVSRAILPRLSDGSCSPILGLSLLLTIFEHRISFPAVIRPLRSLEL